MSLAVAPGSTKTVLIKFVSGSAPNNTTIGGVVSCTVTVNVLFVVIPPADAVTVTVLVPRGNIESEAGTLVVATAPEALVAEVLKLTNAPDGPVASTVILAGTVITIGEAEVAGVNAWTFVTTLLLMS